MTELSAPSQDQALPADEECPVDAVAVAAPEDCDVPAEVEADERRRDEVAAMIEQTKMALLLRGYALWSVDWPGGLMCIAENRDIGVVLAHHPDVPREELAKAFSYPLYTLFELRELNKSHWWPDELRRVVYDLKRKSPIVEVQGTEVKKRAHK